MSRESILAPKPRSLKRAEITGIIVISRFWQDKHLQQRLDEDGMDPSFSKEVIKSQGIRIGQLMHSRNLRWTLNNIMSCFKPA